MKYVLRVVALPGGIAVGALMVAANAPASWAIPAAATGAFFLLDTVFRLRDYRRLVRQSSNTVGIAAGIGADIVRRYRTSFCHRQVAIAAWQQQMAGTVWDNWTARYYHSQGYRWYHILPDGFPGCLLKRNWWRSFLAGNGD